ncbi:Vps62-related protein [Chromobacterium subtsugae]|uniref:Vps62-related protein n=1 Tax=Chromobacterium subtsugae TaxID=251747 RepID=UPI0006410E41|nr:Vps62-related protein [Chromobacterium subtsugae]
MNSPEIVKQILDAGSARLIVTTISNYLHDPIYTDKGTGSAKDVSIWRPAPTNPNQYIIGDHAQGDHGKSGSGAIQVVEVENDDGSAPLLALPIDYTLIWTDKGSGGSSDGSIWLPNAPAGYVAIGSVAQSDYSKPYIPNYRCIRRDLVSETSAGDLIWNDEKSGAELDVSLYAIASAPGAFYANKGYGRPSGPFYCIKL